MALEVKAAYTMRELAAAGGMDIRKMRRLLVACGVAPVRTGPRSEVVMLESIRVCLKELWASIVGADAARALATNSGNSDQ